MSYFKLEDYEKAKQQEQELRARAAADILVATDPAGGDKAAKVMTMSQALGVPAVVYDQNMDYFDAQFQRMQNERVLKRSTALTKWITSAPENAAVAADDLPALSFWDAAATSVGMLPYLAGKMSGASNAQPDNQLGGTLQSVTRLDDAAVNTSLRILSGASERQAATFQAAEQDRNRTFSEILADEVARRRRPADQAAQPSELEKRAGLGGLEEALAATDAPPGLFDMLNASMRWFATRTNDLVGVDNKAQAEGWRKWAANLLELADQYPNSPKYKIGAEIFQKAPNTFGGILGAMADGFQKDPAAMMAFFLETAAGSLPQVAVGAGTAAVGGIPAGMAAYFGSSYFSESGTQTLEQYQKAGIDITTQEGRDRLWRDPELVRKANEIGLIKGLVVATFDALSLGVAGSTLAANPVVDRIAQVFAQVAMASAGEMASQDASGSGRSWSDIMVEGLAEAFTAPIEIWSATQEMKVEEARAKKAEANKTFFEELAKKSGESKLRQRLPAKFREFVDAATKNGPVSTLWVPADKFAGYWQTQGLDPEQIADAIPGVGADKFQEALASGSDIAIPTASYAAHMAGSQHDAFFIDNMRLSPEQMTFAEARDFEAAKADLLAQTMDQADRARLEAEMETRIEERIFQRMRDSLRAGGISKIEAENNAVVWPAFFTTMAERANMTTEELADRIGLPRVEGETPQGMMGLEDQTRFTSMMREVRARAAQVAQVGGTPSAPSADLPAGLTTEDVASLVGPELSGGPAQDAIRAAQIDDIIRYLDELGANLDTMTDEQVRQMVQSDVQPREGGAAAGRRFAQTVALRRGSETLAKLGIEPGGRYTTREIATALEARQRKKWGTIDASDRSPETSRKIASWMVDEVLFEVEYAQQNPEKSAVGWYSEKYQRALDSMAAAFPEFTSDAAFSDASLPGLQILKSPKNARDFFTALMAITSDGAKVADNFRFAAMAYSDFRRTGRVNSDVTFGGERNKSMRLNLENIQETLDKVGADEMASYLLQKDTVKNLKKIAQEQGRDFSTAYKASMELPYSALIFGPKLGAFYANLMGDTGYLTMDRWWSRTFNRYRGTLLQTPTAEGLARFKELVTADRRLNAPAGEMTDDEALALTADYVRSYKAKGYKNGTEIEKAANTLYKAAFEGLEDQPFNASDREFMINTTLAAQKMLARRGVNLTVADIQAVLWYYEKRLYGQLGARQSQDISYEEIARKVASVASSGGDLALGSNDEVAGGAGDQEGLNGPASGDLSAEPEVDIADEAFSEAGSTFNQEALNGQGTAGNGTGRYAAGGLAPLPGAPNVEGASGPDPRLVSVAEQYARDNGLDLRRQAEFVEVDPERAKRIADAYAQMPHAPQDPQVKTAYAELIRQTVAQYRALEAAGYRFWFFDENTDPYGGNPWNAMRDLRANQSMAVYATEAGFGSGATDLNVDDNPMLADTGIEWSYGSPDGPKKRVLANDLFRAVHDAFGHGIEGAGFRARGEENAWQAHVRLFYGPAVAAITTETRGQNSWLNYGPYGEKNRTAAVEDTVFADQKTGLMPEWTWTEGRAGDMAPVMNAGTPPELNANGMVELQHFSKETRATIDPAFAGTGPMRGTERRMAGPAKSYYGISTGKPGGYVRERMLGDVLHTVELDPARLYNWFEDPMRLKDGLDRSASSEQQVAQYEQLIKDAGFAGYWVNQGPNGASAAVFEALPVTRVESAKRPVPPQFLKKQPKLLFQSDKPQPVVASSSRTITDFIDGQRGWTVEELHAKATVLQDKLAAVGERAGKVAGAKFINPKVKDLQTTRDKIPRKGYDGPHRLTDTARIGFEVTSASQAEKIVSELAANFEVVDEQWAVNFTGYFDRKVLVRDETGVVGEVQIIPLQIFRAKKEKLGATYVEWRALDPSTPEAEALRKQMVDGYYASVAGTDFVGILETSRSPNSSANRALQASSVNTAPELATSTKSTLDQSAPGVSTANASAPVSTAGLQSQLTNSIGLPPDQSIGGAAPNGNGYVAENASSVNGQLNQERTTFGPRGSIEFAAGDPTQTEAFKNWFGSSKVVDESGKPLVVYHGTKGDFSSFDAARQGQSDFGASGRGFYFSQDPDTANVYAQLSPGEGSPNIMPVYLSLQNPYELGAMLPRNEEESRLLTERVKSEGFDGIIVRGNDGVLNEIIAFSPTQIKSATGNSGAFDPNNPSILSQDRTTFGPRGSIEFAAGGLGKGETVIRLFRSRDLSTFMHESGHFFLSALQLLAQDTQGAPQVAAMYDTVKGWWRNNAAAVARDGKSVTGTEVTAADVIAALDNGTSGDADKDIAIDVGMQEQWARAFEAYLMEGKSPSKELRTVFERMRAWLLAVYRSVTNLNVEISDDIRSVFDRMLATDRQIAEASKQSGFEVMSAADAEKVGILPEDYAKLRELHADVLEEASARVLADTMRPIRQQQEAWYRDERAKVEAEVRDRLALEPVFRAIKALRFGKDANDEVIDPPIKLSREAIAQAYDKRFLTTLPGLTKNGGNHRFSVMANEGGMAPDVAAEMFGFASGQSLLEALESAPRFEDAVRAEVEKVMFERHGDPLRDGTVETAAMEEIHGDRKARYLEEELRLLSRPAGKGPKATLAAEVKFVARQTLSRMLVKDARRANRFLTAERKAGADALKAIASGNRDAAVEAKRRQLLNHHLYAEASKVDAEIEKIQAKVKRQFKGSDEKLSKTKDINYVKAARAVAAKFGLVAPDTDFDFNMWLEQLKFEDPISADAIYQAIDAYSQDAKPYEELTVERLRGVAMAIDSVLEVGKVARQMEIDGKKIERADALAELVPIAEARRSANPLVKDSIKVRFLTLMSALRRVGDWARDMDDGQIGPFSRYMVKPIMDAVGRYKEDRAVRLKELLDIINGRKAELFGKAIMAPEIGHTFANKGELIHAMLHLGNESNMRKLLLGYGWAVENYFQTGGKKGIATNRWDAFMARAQADGTITKEDWDMVQQIWDLLESTKRPAQAAHKRIYGFYFNEVEARPITTPFGVYKGGYAPAIVDKFLTAEGDIRASEQSEQMPATAMFPTTGSGFTKSRVENYAAKLELNLMLLPAHLDKVLRFTHLEPVVRQTGSLLRDRALAEPLKQQNPAILNSMLFPWLQRVAQQAVEQPAQTDAGRQMAKFWRGIRSRVGIATMFANVVNVLQQITGFSTAAVIVKPTYLKSAMFRFVSDGAAMRQTMIDTSPFMKDRATNQQREILNRIEEAVVKPTTMAEMNDWFKRHGYFLQQAFQNFMDPIVWHAAYDQAIANGATASDAAFEADQAIQRSQSDNSPEILSTFETGPAFQRLFTMFYSYFGAQANMIGTEVSTAMRTMGWNGKKRLFWIYVAGLAIPAIVSEMIVQAFRGGLEDDDDDGYADELMSLFLLSQARYALASVPVVSQFSNAVIGQFTKEYYDDRVSTSPVIGAVERAIRAPSSVAAAIEDPEKSPRAVSDGLFALGLILGVPAGQLAKTAGYVTGIATGRSNPETPIDLVQGAVSGRDGTER